MGTGTEPQHDILAVLPDGVVVADQAGVVTFLNDAVVPPLGGRDSAGKPPADVVPLQDRAGNSWFTCADPYDGLCTRTGLAEQAWYLSDGTELLVTGRIAPDRPRQAGLRGE